MSRTEEEEEEEEEEEDKQEEEKEEGEEVGSISVVNQYKGRENEKDEGGGTGDRYEKGKEKNKTATRSAKAREGPSACTWPRRGSHLHT